MSEQHGTEAEIEEKLQAFLETIEESETYQQFIEANEQLKKDPEAMALVEEYQQKRERIQSDFDQSTMQELRELQEEMTENEIINQHRQAEEAFVELLQRTDDAISERIGRQFAQSTGGGCC